MTKAKCLVRKKLLTLKPRYYRRQNLERSHTLRPEDNDHADQLDDDRGDNRDCASSWIFDHETPCELIPNDKDFLGSYSLSNSVDSQSPFLDKSERGLSGHSSMGRVWRL